MMRIFAADDEALALESLVSAIRQAAPEAQLDSFTSPSKLLEFAENHPCDVAFLDIEMGAASGISAAKQLKLRYPKVNIIFVTGYSSYMQTAFKLRSSGYLLKPVSAAAVEEELQNLRNPLREEPQDKLVVHCFGNFDVFWRGKSLQFEHSKTKEMLAYLIDRRGGTVTSGELRAVLWPEAESDKNTGTYLIKLKKDLAATLQHCGAGHVFVTAWNRYAIDPEQVSCDYYEFLAGHPEGIQAYNGEYMNQYDWGEAERAVLQR